MLATFFVTAKARECSVFNWPHVYVIRSTSIAFYLRKLHLKSVENKIEKTKERPLVFGRFSRILRARKCLILNTNLGQDG